MNRSLTFTLFFASITHLAACGGGERELDGYNETAYEVSEASEWIDDFGGNIDAFNGSLRGDIGSLTQLNGIASVNGYGEAEYADVEVMTIGSSGSAMHLLQFVGGLDHPALTPGAHLEFNGSEDDVLYSDGNELFVYSMNCSGEGQPYDWDYDQQADRVTLDVSETDEEGVIQIDYQTEATTGPFQNDVQTSSGSFLLRR